MSFSSCAREASFDPEKVWGYYATLEHTRYQDSCDGLPDHADTGRCFNIECKTDCSAPSEVQLSGVAECDTGRDLDIRIESLLPDGERWVGREHDTAICTESCRGGTTANCTHMCPAGTDSCVLTSRISTLAWVEPGIVSLEIRHLRHDVAVLDGAKTLEAALDTCTDDLARSLEGEMRCVTREVITAERTWSLE